MNRAILLLLTSMLVLTGCRRQEPRIVIVEGQKRETTTKGNLKTALAGTPQILGLSWSGQNSDQARDMLIKKGMAHLTRGTSSNTVMDMYGGKVFNRNARIITEHHIKTNSLLRIHIYIGADENIRPEYARIKNELVKSYGKAPTLFLPQGTGDASYRKAASLKDHPITGWVFKNGYAVSLSLEQPFREHGNFATMIMVGFDSPTWRRAHTPAQVLLK